MFSPAPFYIMQAGLLGTFCVEPVLKVHISTPHRITTSTVTLTCNRGKVWMILMPLFRQGGEQNPILSSMIFGV